MLCPALFVVEEGDGGGHAGRTKGLSAAGGAAGGGCGKNVQVVLTAAVAYSQTNQFRSESRSAQACVVCVAVSPLPPSLPVVPSGYRSFGEVFTVIYAIVAEVDTGTTGLLPIWIIPNAIRSHYRVTDNDEWR